MKILSVIGARPEFVKEAPLTKAIKKRHKEVIVNTGQHYDHIMSKVFFGELEIPKPDYNLGVGSSSHAKQIADMLSGLEPVLKKENPDLVLVSGDTNTTIAGALAASKLGIKLAHIESGMRSFDRTMPEEINRIVTDHVSDILFCSTRTAESNLHNEGIRKNVFVVGDVMIDAIKENLKLAEKKSRILPDLRLNKNGYMLATVHRASNTDNEENLKNIVGAFADSKEKIVFPVHPRTDKCLKKYGLYGKLKNSNIIVAEPVGYMDMLVLEKNSRKILTDSGGVQKEAYYFGVPCITLRDSTEWTETIEDGWNVLAGADKRKITDAIKKFNPRHGQKEKYGSGKASEKIVRILGNSI